MLASGWLSPSLKVNGTIRHNLMGEVKFILSTVWNRASRVYQAARSLGSYLKILVQSFSCGPSDC